MLTGRKLIGAGVAATIVLLAGIASAAPTYLRSTVGQPWGVNTNETAMNAVFGGGGWTDGRYETINVATLFATPDFIFMEGGDDNANEMETFINANTAAVSTYVNNGGVIFFNSAPNEGNGMTYGFGVNLVYGPGPFCGANCNAVNPAHPIFNGPFATGTSFGGTSFSHAITGGALTSLIQDSSANTLLGELSVGSGLALFGGMTTTNFHNPQPAAQNLRQNILAYGAANVNAAPVPEPATLTLFGLGLAGLGFARRRKKLAA